MPKICPEGCQPSRQTERGKGEGRGAVVKYPDEDELGVAGASVGVARVVVDGAGDGPQDETDDHAADAGEEQRAAAVLGRRWWRPRW